MVRRSAIQATRVSKKAAQAGARHDRCRARRETRAVAEAGVESCMVSGSSPPANSSWNNPHQALQSDDFPVRFPRMRK